MTSEPVDSASTSRVANPGHIRPPRVAITLIPAFGLMALVVIQRKGTHMRNGLLCLAVILGMLAPVPGRAQAARVGRLPVLEPPRAGVGSCRNNLLTGALRQGGLDRMINYRAADSNWHRLITLSLNVRGEPVMLMATMGTKDGRRGESETVGVNFGPGGTIERGRRSATTTGMPARVSDDRQLGLLPGDTLAARRLETALRQRCRT